MPLAFGLLHVAVLAWVAGMLWGRRAALVAAAIAAVSWELAWSSFELRSFSLACLLTALAWAGTIRWLRSGRGRWLAVTGLAAAGALYTFYYTAVPLLGLAVFVGVSKPQTRRGWAWLLAGLLASSVFAPWLPVFFEQLAFVREWTRAGHGAAPFLDPSSHLSLLRAHTLRLGLTALLTFGSLLALSGISRLRGAPAPRIAEVLDDRGLKAVGAYGLACIALIVVMWAAGSVTATRYAIFLVGIWSVFSAGCIVRIPGPASTLVLLIVHAVPWPRWTTWPDRTKRSS